MNTPPNPTKKKKIGTKTLSLHPDFLPFLDRQPGPKSRGQKIEQKFGFDRKNPPNPEAPCS